MKIDYKSAVTVKNDFCAAVMDRRHFPQDIVMKQLA